jgi:hypothetical protein
LSFELSAYIATFRTSQAAIGAERALRALTATIGGCKEELIPVPRGISSDCGFCLLLTLGEETATSPRADEKEVISFFEDRDCEELFRVLESSIPGKRRKEKRYERVKIC